MNVRIVVLTPGQNAVVQELARDGADDLTIAGRLGIAKNTVKTHLKRAMAKTGHNQRAALAVAVARQQISFRIEDGRGWRNTQARIARGEWT